MSIHHVISTPLLVAILTLRVAAQEPGFMADCNRNEVEDALDISSGASQDCDSDGIPDDCQEMRFRLWIEGQVGRKQAVPALAAGDLDGDGKAELAVLTHGQDPGLTIYEIEDDSSFTERIRLPVSENSDLLRIVDIEGDGDLDILLNSGPFGDSVTLLTRTAPYEFTARVLFVAPGHVRAFEVLDLDGDTYPDLLYTYGGDGQAGVRLSRGESAEYTEEIPFPGADWIIDLAAHDLDGDGREEAIFRSDTGDLIAHVLGEEGQLEEIQRIHLAPATDWLEFEDLDGDGRIDLITGGRDDPSLRVYYRGEGDEFQQEERLSIPGLGSVASFVSKDFDRDGYPDLAVSDGQVHQVLVLRGQGGRRFDPPTFLPVVRGLLLSTMDTGVDGNSCLVFSANFGLSGSVFGLASARLVDAIQVDCDGDGIRDRCEIAAGEEPDANGDGLIDTCQVANRLWRDCDDDGIEDSEQIAGDGTLDCNANGILDSCEVVESPLRIEQGTRFMHTGSIDQIRGVTRAPGEGQDLVAWSSETRELLVANEETGGFETWLPLPEDVRQLAWGDLDGDGTDDLVMQLESGELRPHLGDGEGGLVPVETMIPTTRAVELRVADLDGDGDEDLLLVYSRLLGGGGLRFGTWLESYRLEGTVLESLFPASDFVPSLAEIHLADVDGDGRADIQARRQVNDASITNSLYQIEIFLNRGAEGYSLVGSVGVEFPLISSEPVDVTGDGRVDLIAYERRQGYFTLAGSGDGTFEPASSPHDFPRREDLAIYHQRVADFDGDGELDLLGRSGRGLTLSLGDGRGNFIEARHFDGRGGNEEPFEILDLRGDGHVDVAFLGPMLSGATVFFGSENGVPLPPSLEGVPDRDRDDRVSIYTPGADGGAVEILRYREGGSLEVHVVLPDLSSSLVSSHGFPLTTSIQAIDLDGNSRIDLLTSYGSGPRAWIQSESGEWLAGASLPPFDPGSSTIADLDSDGDDDLAILDEDRRLSIHLSRGDGEFSVAHEQTFPHGVLGLGAGDFDGDGLMDLLTFDRGTSELVCLEGLGGGSFESIQDSELRTTLPWEISTDLFLLRVADLDDDGQLDVLWHDHRNEFLRRGLGTGNGRFTVLESLPVPRETQNLSVGRLDGDPLPDLVYHDRETESFRFLRGVGHGEFEDPVVIGRFDSQAVQSLIDIDRDGILDVVSHGRPGRLAAVPFRVILNHSLPFSRDCDEDGLLDACTLALDPVLDLDGDGRLDRCELDCNENGIPDSGEVFEPDGPDCNENGIEDDCEISSGVSRDLDGNGVPDSCDPDCDGNGLPDAFEIWTGQAEDCDGNGIPDACDLELAPDRDRDGNGTLDVCDEDCDENGVADFIEIEATPALDCNGDGILDACAIADRPELDRNLNSRLDVCEEDCDGDGIADFIEIEDALASDCDRDGVPDLCEISENPALDRNSNSRLDACEEDCDENGLPDFIEIEDGLTTDCDGDGQIDSCQIAAGGPHLDVNDDGILDACQDDCDEDGVPDVLQISSGLSEDLNENGILDVCEGGLRVPGDCNADGMTDLSDPLCLLGHLFQGDPVSLPCDSELGSRTLLDWQGDGLVDLSDAILMLTYEFAGGRRHVLVPEGGNPGACRRLIDCQDLQGCQ